MLRTKAVKSLFCNSSIVPEAVVHDELLSHCTPGPICTSPFASVANSPMSSDLGAIFVCLDTSIRRRASTSMTFTCCALVLSLGSSCMSLMAIFDTGSV